MPPRRHDPVQPVMLHPPVAACLSRDQVAPRAQKNPVGFQSPFAIRLPAAGIGDREDMRALQRLADDRQQGRCDRHARSGPRSEAVRLQHRLGTGLGTTRMRAGHRRKQAVTQARKGTDISCRAIALGPAYRQLHRGQLAIPDTLRQHQPRLACPEFPELAPVIMDFGCAMRKGLFQCPGHALSRSPVDSEGFLDVRQRHSPIAG